MVFLLSILPFMRPFNTSILCFISCSCITISPIFTIQQDNKKIAINTFLVSFFICYLLHMLIFELYIMRIHLRIRLRIHLRKIALHKFIRIRDNNIVTVRPLHKDRYIFPVLYAIYLFHKITHIKYVHFRLYSYTTI